MGELSEESMQYWLGVVEIFERENSQDQPGAKFRIGDLVDVYAQPQWENPNALHTGRITGVVQSSDSGFSYTIDGWHYIEEEEELKAHA